MGVQCTHCDGEIFVGKLDSVVVFFCRHAYHASCLEQQRIDVHSSPMCPKCNVGRARGRTRGPTYTGTRRPIAAVTASSGTSTVTSTVIGTSSSLARQQETMGPDRITTEDMKRLQSSRVPLTAAAHASTASSSGSGGKDSAFSFAVGSATSGRLAAAPDRFINPSSGATGGTGIGMSAATSTGHLRTAAAIPPSRTGVTAVLSSSSSSSSGVGSSTTPRSRRT
jgi:hypothetical protein